MIGTRAAALWRLTRPRLALNLWLVLLMGFAWGHWDHRLRLQGAGSLCWILAGWWALNAGTMWLNASLDQDEGEVLWGARGREAIEPDALRWPAIASLVAAPALAGLGAPLAGGAGLLCAGLAFAYSWPSIRWKSHPLAGPLVNWIGYGLMTPLAGWAAVEVEASARGIALWGAWSVGILGCYFLAQVFQAEEDRARGDRTLAASAGPAAALRAGRLLIGASALTGIGIAASGAVPATCLWAAPLYLWVDRGLAAWGRDLGGGERRARAALNRMLLLAVAGIALATVDWYRTSGAWRMIERAW